jgi:hypothetical protein
MENRIKEQLQPFSDRCHRWWPNQFRVLLSALGARRLLAPPGPAGNRTGAGPGGIRLKPFKIGAVIPRNTRRVRFPLSSAYPAQDLFRLAAQRLAPG